MCDTEERIVKVGANSPSRLDCEPDVVEALGATSALNFEHFVLIQLHLSATYGG